MSYTYRLIGETTVFKSNGESIPFDLRNNAYLAYLEWLSEGNEPLPPYPNQ